MTIISLVSVFADCDSQDPDGDCHSYIEIEFNSVVNCIDQDSYEDWLGDQGWLVLGEDAFCPSCRKQLHD